MSETKKLKDCPFCGCPVEVNRYKFPNGEKSWRITGMHEPNCMFELSFYWPECPNKRQLIRAWNRRSGNA